MRLKGVEGVDMRACWQVPGVSELATARGVDCRSTQGQWRDYAETGISKTEGETSEVEATLSTMFCELE